MEIRRSSRLASKPPPITLVPASPTVPVAVHSQANTSIKTNAQRCKEYRQRLKRYRRYEYRRQVEKACAKSLLTRRNQDEESRKIYNEKTKMRMRRYRERNNAEEVHKKGTRADVVAHEQQKRIWREQYKQKASVMTHQKRASINAKRRERYAQKKMGRQRSTHTQTTPVGFESPTNSEDRSTGRIRKATKRLKRYLPKERELKAAVLTSTIHELTPGSKNKVLGSLSADASEKERIGCSVLRALKEARSNSTHNRHIRKALFPHIPGSELRQAELTNSCRKTIKRLHRDKKLSIRHSYISAEKFLRKVAVVLPHKKNVSKKTGEPSSFLQQTLTTLHRQFLAEHGDVVSFSTFAKSRPLSVKLMSKATLNMCLCEYCANVRLKLEVLGKEFGVRMLDEVDALRQTMCSVKSYACMHRECKDCGRDLMSMEAEERAVSWHRWEMKEVTFKGKKMTRKVLATKQDSSSHFFLELNSELRFLSGHIFRAHFQHRSFVKCKESSGIPGIMTMVLDFAENYTCLYNNEVQSAHWHHEQVTIHPTVIYYKCDKCSEVTTESVVAISNDLKHDHHIVHNIMTDTIHHLKHTRKLNITKIHLWSDGCLAHYKSKGPFADIAWFYSDHGIPMERHYFGSRHGKGASDGESAVVKSSATRAVKSNSAIIASAKDFFQYCHSNLTIDASDEKCNHFLRTFIFVPSEAIKRNRRRAPIPLKGSRMVHHIRPTKEGLETRYLSCYCSGMCENQCKCKEVTNSCKTVLLKGVPLQDIPDLPLQVQDTQSLVQTESALIDEDITSTTSSTPVPVPNPVIAQDFGLNKENAPDHECKQAGENDTPSHSNNKSPSQADGPSLPLNDITDVNDSEWASPNSTPGETQKKNLDTLIPGAWVLAFVPGKKGSQTFLGMVLQSEEHEAQIKFCRQHGDYFSWPRVDDIGWMPNYALVTIEAPCLDARERMFLTASLREKYF